ncbi:MAG: HEPN domain-containing protein [bacterium]
MTVEQTALLQKSQESLRAARLLAEQGFYDFAVSRAYYAMFYVAEAFLLGEGLAYSN